MTTRLALCAALLAGCTYSMKRSDPRPNILLAQSPRSLAIELAPPIPRDLRLQEGLSAVPLTGWRGVLERGFHNGFDRFYASGQPGDRLVLLRVEPSMIVVEQHRDASTWMALIAYQAELVGPDGAVKQRFADRAQSPPQSLSTPYGSDLLVRAVENMYERIARQIGGQCEQPAPPVFPGQAMP